MGLLVIICTGAALGWLATVIEGIDQSGGVIVRHMAVGIFGAMTGAAVFAPLIFGSRVSGDFASATALMLGVAGSVAALSINKLLMQRALH
ncbi:hypothetical protein ACXYN8_09895 [Altererythrobacter sp. CAU 1778]